MICQNCGAIVEEEARFCPHCGQPISRRGNYRKEAPPSIDLSTPWRYDPDDDRNGHTLLYKIMASVTGMLLLTATVLVALAWRATRGI